MEPIAKKKQSQVKSSSPAEASATPATTGSRQALTFHGSTSFMKIAPKTTLKKGSKDLTTCHVGKGAWIHRGEGQWWAMAVH